MIQIRRNGRFIRASVAASETSLQTDVISEIGIDTLLKGEPAYPGIGSFHSRDLHIAYRSNFRTYGHFVDCGSLELKTQVKHMRLSPPVPRWPAPKTLRDEDINNHAGECDGDSPRCSGQ
jgi:hypothetical protein